MFVHRLQKLIEAVRPERPEAAPVLCACFPDEQHQMGALVLAYHLTRCGSQVSYLGAALPLEELERACDLLSPRAVYLSVTRPELYLIHRPRLLELLERKGREIRFFIGGCGIEREDPEVLKQGGRLWPGQRSARELSLDFLPRGSGKR
jgi:methylmalonyl-CoA mutase cobalamin-binding subunit